MPNWTGDDGVSDFGKLTCKRCNQMFKYDKHGEVPVHKCLNEYAKSKSMHGEYHCVVWATPKEIEDFLAKKTKKKIKKKVSTIDAWEKSYSEFRSKMFIQIGETSNHEIANRLADLLNTFESANKIFIHFNETGKVELDALD